MQQTARVFKAGNSQAVRLPKNMRFDVKDVFIWRDQKTGDIILSARPENLDYVFALLKKAEVPADFLSPQQRAQGFAERNPFADLADADQAAA
jgi:antitoxin VapB